MKALGFATLAALALSSLTVSTSADAPWRLASS
jgi:hypothetical protein